MGLIVDDLQLGLLSICFKELGKIFSTSKMYSIVRLCIESSKIFFFPQLLCYLTQSLSSCIKGPSKAGKGLLI